ncbi:MAG: hypothetical protein DI571_06435 [Arsenicicoccus sp.]|nr:MAG: hypothetical protein DI571_06435 [Arsenicicoccus sp.]
MRSTTGVAVAVLASVAALTLLAWGSSSGEPLLGPPQGMWEPTIGLPPPPAVPEVVEATQAPGEEEPTEREGPPVDWLLLGFLALAVAVALVFTEEDEQLVALLEASGDDVRYRALAESDPRNAVVACWVTLEEAARRSGLHDNPAETASELTRRVLGRWQVDETSIRELSEAYREARFSRHPVTEQQRDHAVAALDRIHQDLRRRVLAEQEAAAAREDAAEHQAGPS